MTYLFRTATNSEVSRKSAPVKVSGVVFNTETRTIEATCSDNNTRLCRVDNCASLEYARCVYRYIQACVKSGNVLVFEAAGNNNPDRWFFNADPPAVEVVDDLSLAAYMANKK